ncbi:hypothetical protein TRFO_26282 [Tritrichomonas foetus]|uniref:Uncharacterized protein n=1 Tax=Tritrichomonas foetus TaxID=1144522 RepID=A0A1J4K3A4_9EUKA|nr:hypothetical protein TRFO_26282 [Tritrichomonas foetus]|eukprot:OHT05855.1 hypothetical protein TRFO_26282 [Tritrichomonas foetus]
MTWSAENIRRLIEFDSRWGYFFRNFPESMDIWSFCTTINIHLCSAKINQLTENLQIFVRMGERERISAQSLQFLNQFTSEILEKACYNLSNPNSIQIGIHNSNGDLQIIIDFFHHFVNYIEQKCCLPEINNSLSFTFFQTVIPTFIQYILVNSDNATFSLYMYKIGTLLHFTLLQKQTKLIQSINQLILMNSKFNPKFVQSNRLEIAINMNLYMSVFSFKPAIQPDSNNEIEREKNILFRPIKSHYDIFSHIFTIFYFSGVFIAIRKFLSDSKSEDCLDVCEFLNESSKFMSNNYKAHFSGELDKLLKNDNQINQDKNINKTIDETNRKLNEIFPIHSASLFVIKTLRNIAELSENHSNFFNKLYFQVISSLIKSKDEKLYQVSLEELSQINKMPVLTQSFVDNLNNCFVELIPHFNYDYNDTISTIDSIYGILDSKSKLPTPKSLLHQISNNFILINIFFDYVKDEIDNNLINEIFNENNFNETMGKVLMKLFKHEKYTSETNFLGIFECFLTKTKTFDSDLFILSSNINFKTDFTKAIFNILQKQPLGDFNALIICKIIGNLKQNFPENELKLLSERIVDQIDSEFIPIIFNEYKFLPIHDPFLFWELSSHSPLFYEILLREFESKKEFNDVFNDLLFYSKEITKGSFDCHLKLYEMTKDIKYFWKSVFIAYSLPNLSIKSQIKEFFINLLQKENSFSLFDELFLILDQNSIIYQNFDISPIQQFLSEINFTFQLINNKINLDKIDMTNFDHLALLLISGFSFDSSEKHRIIHDLIFSESIFASTIASSFVTNEIETKEQFLKLLLKNIQIGNNKICYNLLNLNLFQIHISEEFIYKSNPQIIIKIFENVPTSSELFDFLPFLSKCETFEQYQTSFLCLVKKEPVTNPEFAPFLWSTFCSDAFPPILRNEVTIPFVFNLITENSTNQKAFLDYLSTLPSFEFSPQHPTISNTMMNIYSNLSSFLLSDTNSSTKNKRFFNAINSLNFSALKEIQTSQKYKNFEDIFDFLPSSFLNNFEIEILSLDHGNITQFSLFINFEKSVSYSIQKFLFMKTIFKFPKHLIIYFNSYDNSNEFIIDDILDLSSFSTTDNLIYQFNSVFTTNDCTYLKSSNGYYCYQPNSQSSFCKIISNPIKFVVYSLVDDESENTILLHSWKNTENRIYYDIASETMKILNNPRIDWIPFLENQVLYPSVIKLLTIHRIKPLFQSVISIPTFSVYLFTEGLLALFNSDFSSVFLNEIIQLARIFPDETVLILILIHDILPENPSLTFNFINYLDFSLDNLLLFFNSLKDMNKKDLYDSDSFGKLFQNLLNKIESKDILHNLIENDSNLILSLLKISDSRFIDLIPMDKVDLSLFESAITISQDEFILNLLIKYPNWEFLKMSSIRLRNFELYQNMILDKLNNDKEFTLSLDFLSNLLRSSDDKFRNQILEIMEKHFPPESTTNYELSKIFIDLLIPDNINMYQCLSKTIDKYRKSFGKSAKITSLYANFIFSHQPSAIPYFENIITFTLSLPTLSPSQIVELMKNNFPLKSTFSTGDYETLYEFLFKLLLSHPIRKINSYIPILETLKKCYLALSNKKYFNELFGGFIRSDMSPSDVVFLFPDIFNFPSAVADNIDKICELNCVKNSMLFSLLIFMVIQLTVRYMDKEVYVSKTDDMNSILLQIISRTNKMLQEYPLSVNWQPFEINNVNFNEIISYIANPFEYDPILNMCEATRIIRRTTSSELLSEILILYKNTAFLLPQILRIMIHTFASEKFNFYSSSEKIEDKIAYSKFICEIFRECFGDRQIVHYQNSQWNSIVFLFFFNKLTALLNSDQIYYQTAKPYLQMITEILTFPNVAYNNQITINCVKGTLIEKMNQFNFELLKLIVNISFSSCKNENNQTNSECKSYAGELDELKQFITIVICNSKYPNQNVPAFINITNLCHLFDSLKAQDSFFSQKIELFEVILRNLPQNMVQQFIEERFDYIDQLNEESLIEESFFNYILENFAC